MNPIKFPEQNVVFAENQPEYIPLPAYRSDDEHGQVVTVWEPSDEELTEIVRTKKVYLSQFTFGQALQPVLLSGHRTTFFESEHIEEKFTLKDVNTVVVNEIFKIFFFDQDPPQGVDPYQELAVHIGSDAILEIVENTQKKLNGDFFTRKEIINAMTRYIFRNEFERQEHRDKMRKKTEADFHYFQTGGDNGPTGHGEDCLSDAGEGL